MATNSPTGCQHLTGPWMGLAGWHEEGGPWCLAWDAPCELHGLGRPGSELESWPPLSLLSTLTLQDPKGYSTIQGRTREASQANCNSQNPQLGRLQKNGLSPFLSH